MARPFQSAGIEELESGFEAARKANDAEALAVIAYELSFRKTPRAKRLEERIAQISANGTEDQGALPLNGGAGNANTTEPEGRGAQRPERPSTSSLGQSKRRPNYKPTDEQALAIEYFKKGGSLKINAYAGTGKTSTLQLLAHATPKRGQYLAFNKSIADEARDKFPNTVACNTTHSLAFKVVAPHYRGQMEKMTGKINANQLAEMFEFKKWRIDRNHTLAPRSQGYLILETIKRFARSSDLDPSISHVPVHGSLLAASEPVLAAVNEFAVDWAKHVWGLMQDPNEPIPLGHDGYLKLWALAQPEIAADFILLDEAQDTNPVVLDVLGRQRAQMIYVGDKYQQIYEWRGAINAMEKIATDHSTFLTTSFRFGPAIAEGATKILRILGEHRPIIGNPNMVSRIGDSKPHAILARTNATTITAIIEALDSGKRPHLVGDKTDIMNMLRGVQDLKAGQPSTVPDFFGFENWQEVVDFAKSGEGEHLLTFVNLVEARGERQLMWALNSTAKEEDQADVIISTAHKAKGREWQTVKLLDDFLRSKPKDKDKNSGTNQPKKFNGHDPAELQLFYVAFTRGKEAVEVDPAVLALLDSGPMPETPRARPAPGSPSIRTAPRQSTQKRAKPSAPQQYQPTEEKRTHQTTDRRAPTNVVKLERPAKRKGLFGWLFGK